MDKDKVVKEIARIIGAACTCSGRTNMDKNLAMAESIYDGLVKKKMI